MAASPSCSPSPTGRSSGRRSPSIIAISAFAVTIQGALLFWGLRNEAMPATAANLILQIQIPFAVLLDWLIMKEKLDLRKAAGTALAILGVAIVIGLPEQAPGLLPTVMIIVSAFCWSLGQVLARKLGKDSGVGLLKANALGSVPQLALATLLLEQGQWQSRRRCDMARMVDAGLRRRRRLLPRLHVLVHAAEAVPHGRGRTLHPADAGCRHHHRGTGAGRNGFARADDRAARVILAGLAIVSGHWACRTERREARRLSPDQPLARIWCSSRRGMISTKLQGLWV